MTKVLTMYLDYNYMVVHATLKKMREKRPLHTQNKVLTIYVALHITCILINKSYITNNNNVTQTCILPPFNSNNNFSLNNKFMVTPHFQQYNNLALSYYHHTTATQHL
jgi:hypothetical protein